MGQKINPKSYRTGISKGWDTRWFFTKPATSGGYRTFLQEDEAIRDTINEKVKAAGIAGVEIERTAGALKVLIRAARPGFIIGRGGKGIEDLTKAIEKELNKISGKKHSGLNLNVEELKRSEVSAAHIATLIATDVEKRIPFRQILRKQLENMTQNKEVLGAKILMSGRLDGAEIARREWKAKGPLPLQTLRADIDYAQATAFTTYGTVGIKVWVYKGEIFEDKGNSKGSDRDDKSKLGPPRQPRRN